jgi:competence/damage-inducible protein CinA-like protein
MIAEILSTGDEVLLGDIVDTNSRFLCEGLKDLGFGVQQITAVGDSIQQISQTLGQIAKRADICLISGGLGPTQDDLTALGCAMAAGEELELNPIALETMEVYFKKRGFELTQDNRKQAMLPASAGVLVNRHGTAPGFYMKLGHCHFFFMPGVPLEMKFMFEEQVKGKLLDSFGLTDKILIERLMVFGMGEARVGTLLEGFEDKFAGMSLGFRARFPFIEVKIVCSTGDPEGSEGSDGEDTVCGDTNLEQMATAREWAISRLENKVISQKGHSLEQEVGRLLKEKKFTLAIAESCTGGMISNLVTDVAGSSDYFLFSAITYSNDAKMNILGVAQTTLETHGAVHEQTALEMAMGVRRAGQADWGISTTGVAGPTGGTDEKPVGTVCIGIAGPGLETSKRYTFNFGSRARNKEMFAATALEVLRRQLVKVQ